MGRRIGSKNKKKTVFVSNEGKESSTIDEREIANRAMKCDNGRIYIYCYRDDDWKEKEVCLKVCSDGGRNRCVSWRTHIDNNPIRARKTKVQVLRENDDKSKD